MNYNTSRDECIMIDILLGRLNSNAFDKSILDIELHIERQKAKIESDIKDLEHKIEEKQFDLECYEWLQKELEKKKVGI